MFILALICAAIAALFTTAIFELLRGIKTHTPKKIIIGIVLMILTFLLLYYVLVTILVAGVQ